MIRLEPEVIAYYLDLASAREADGRPEDAAEALAEALRVDPNHAEARSRLGFLCLRLGRWEEARAQYEALKGLSPDQAEELKAAMDAH